MKTRFLILSSLISCVNLSYGMDSTNQQQANNEKSYTLKRPEAGANQSTFLDFDHKKVYKILDKNQMIDELINNAIYTACRIKTANPKVIQNPDSTLLNAIIAVKGVYNPATQIMTESTLIDGFKGQNNAQDQNSKYNAAGLSNFYNNPNIVQKVQKAFIVDCFLRAWDMRKGDNTIIDTQENPVVIDLGSGFMYRAMGAKKEGKVFDFEELDTLRNSGINFESATVFKDIEPKEISALILEFLGKREAIFNAIDELKSALKEKSDSKNEQEIRHIIHRRFESLQMEWFKRYEIMHIQKQNNYVPTNAYGAVIPGSSASVLLISNGSVLLGKRKGEEGWWGNLGGGSELTDKTL